MLLFVLSSSTTFCQTTDVESVNTWTTYQISNSNMEIKFPLEPSNELSDQTKVQQLTRKVYVRNYDGHHFVFFISIVKLKKELGTSEFKGAVSLITDLLKRKYTFENETFKDTTYKNCIAETSEATVHAPNGDSFKYQRLGFKRKELIGYMFVLTDNDYVDSKEVVSFFFNSLEWKD